RSRPARPGGRLDIRTLIANPEAIAARRRYVDADLNRRFGAQTPGAEDPQPREAALARELDRALGPKGAERTGTDCIIDLHTTNANMGTTIVPVGTDPLSVAILRKFAAFNASARILLPGYGTVGQQPYLPSVVPVSFTLEIGPVVQNTLSHAAVVAMETALRDLLRAIEEAQEEIPDAPPVTAYRPIGPVLYPRDAAGRPTAMVHAAREGRDYEPVAPGGPLLRTFDGEVVAHRGEGPVYPVFINEAAYQPDGIAMVLAEPVPLSGSDPAAK
ncbi:aspartoacylase, partial [Arenibaculum sp.]|uniref:aspartoacylase n=1 Tax=Arenibaculum sp. TaxID=2865862 RepID=UPI002E13AC7C|nr:aspartoacylase [Arenibaculum sp.]